MESERRQGEHGGDVNKPPNHKRYTFLSSCQILDSHSDEVQYVEFSHNGNYLASSSKDQSAIIWEMNVDQKFSLKHRLVGHTKPVVMVLWSPDDQQVITCGADEDIRRWDVESGDCLYLYEKFGVGPYSCEWFLDGKCILGAMLDRCICIWNLDGTGHDDWIEQRVFRYKETAMTDDRRWQLTLRDTEISLFDRKNNVNRLIKENEHDRINSFSLSKNNKYLLVNLASEKIVLWKLEDDPAGHVLTYIGHKRNRFTIRSCLGGYQQGFIASGAEGGKVYIREKPRRKFVHLLKGHSEAVNCVSWNPSDLLMLASASKDGTVRIWRVDHENLRIDVKRPNLNELEAKEKSTLI